MDDTEQEPGSVIDKVVPLSNLKDCDSSIQSNAWVQLPAGCGMVLAYFIFRRKAPWVYYPNIKNKPQHPCYQENPGFLGWVFPMLTTKDTELLSMVGLDGFMFLQTIKLLYRICFILALLITPLLCSWFYKTKMVEDKTQFFVALSIWNVKKAPVFWATLGISYLLTLIIFYLIFIYYKRYTTLRQLYLASPATMTSVLDLKNISKELGGDQNAIDYINVSSRTVLIDRLPANIKNDEELLKYVESLKLGEIESVSLIHDTYQLQKMYEQRNETIQNIEKEVTLALSRMKKFYALHTIKCKASFGDVYTSSSSGAAGDTASRSDSNPAGAEPGGSTHPISLRGTISSTPDGNNTPDNSRLADLEKSAVSLFGHSSFVTAEKVALFNNFCKNGDSFFAKTWARQNVVTFHITKLQEINRQISEEKTRIQHVTRETALEIPQADEELFVDSDIRHDVSFFSFSQITNFSENKDFFTLDLPMNKRKAFITFKDQRTAGIVQQTKLGSRAFSSNIKPAPAPSDVMWRTIGKNEVTGFFFKIVSLALYALFIFAFLFLVVKIIETLGIKTNEKNAFFKFIKEFQPLETIYQSILVPLVYNILLYFVPIILKALIHMEDIYSFSDVQVRLMYRFSLFLFFNAFIATFITSCVVQLTSGEKDLTIPELLQEFSSSVIKASVFFFNTIVQRMCIGMGIVFLKPSPFLYNFLLARFVIYTRRQRLEQQFTPPIDFGNHIPNLLLVLPMALVYSCICPIMLVVSWLFYFINYFIYKNELLYATRNDYESGGSYWKPTVRFIFFSVITFQIVTAILTFSEGFHNIFYFFLPLIFVTFIFSEGLNLIFDRSTENFPLNAPEERFLDKFSKKTLEERFKILKNWKEIGAEADEDILSIAELGFEDTKADLSDSFYRDPALLTSIGNIILPSNFFRMAHFLRSFDQKNLFGLKR